MAEAALLGLSPQPVALTVHTHSHTDTHIHSIRASLGFSMGHKDTSTCGLQGAIFFLSCCSCTTIGKTNTCLSLYLLIICQTFKSGSVGTCWFKVCVKLSNGRFGKWMTIFPMEIITQSNLSKSEEWEMSVLLLFVYSFMFPCLRAHTHSHRAQGVDCRAAQGQQVINYRALHSSTISPSSSLPLFCFGRSTHPPWPC